MSLLRDVAAVCRMIKIEHSVFALPFAFTGAFLAAGGVPGWRQLFFLTVAMVAVRSFAMGYNRLADLDIDSQNPRTKMRPLVTGELSVSFTKRFLLVCAVVFTTACWAMNPLCLMLAPVALGWSAFYSHTKRFTPLCHFVLGTVLGLAPLAGWLAVDPSGLTAPAALLFLAVTCWVAGFDILYACQDAEFDRSLGLFSLPARLGVAGALRVSSWTHGAAAALFPLAMLTAGLSGIALGVTAVVGAILVLEHRLIRPDDLSRVNVAFFTLNGVIAVGVFLGVWIDLALFPPQ